MVIYNQEWFLNRIKEKRSDYSDYTILSEYQNSHKKVKIRHNTCGNIFYMSPNSFLCGRGCPPCGTLSLIKKQLKTNEQINKEIEHLHIHLVGKYTGAFNHVLVHCDICNADYSVRIHDLKEHDRCPNCSGRRRKTQESFEKEVKELVDDDEYTVLGKFTTVHNKILMKHNKCGTEYMVTPHNFLRGKRCPRCAVSHGEDIISRILRDMNIEFIPQKRFEGCRDKNTLPFDFYLPKQNVLIEYQGEQHYSPQKHFGGEEYFSYVAKHDEIKLNFSISKGINLICINYKINTYDDIKNYILKHMND